MKIKRVNGKRHFQLGLLITAFLGFFVGGVYAVDSSRIPAPNPIIGPEPSCYEPQLVVTPSVASMSLGQIKQFRAELITHFPMGSTQASTNRICPQSDLSSVSKQSSTQLSKTRSLGELKVEQAAKATITPARLSLISWKSSNTGLATVDQSGKVEIVGLSGRVTLTAVTKYDGRTLKDTATINITPPSSGSIKVTLEPNAIKLTEVGQRIKLNAFVDGKPIGAILTSSNPDEIAVENGYAVAKSATGSALISAHLITDVEHEPGLAVAMVVRQHEHVIDVADSFVEEVKYDAPNDDLAEILPYGTMVLDREYYTSNQRLVPGDVITNMTGGSLIVNEVQEQGDTIVVRGQMPALVELYDELDIHFSSEEIGTFAELYESRSGKSFFTVSSESIAAEKSVETPTLETVKMAELSAGDTSCETHIDFSWSTDSDFSVSVKVEDSTLMTLATLATLDFDTLFNPIPITAGMNCSRTLVEPRALLGLQIPGWVTFVPHLYLDWFVQASVNVNNSLTPELYGPYASASTGVTGGLTYDQGVVTTQGSAKPIDLLVNMNLIDTDFSDNSLTLDVQTGPALGVNWAIVPGSWPVKPGDTIWTKLSILNINLPEAQIALGREYEFPFAMWQSVSNPDYIGPAGRDYLQGKLYLIGEVELGGLVDMVLSIFNKEVPPASLTGIIPGIDFFPELSNSWPNYTDFSVSNNTVYVGGFPPGDPMHALYPDSIVINAPVSRWLPQVVPDWAQPWTHMEIWRRNANLGGSYSKLMDGITSENVVYKPQAGDEGEYDLRGHLFYSPFFLYDLSLFRPHVSQPAHLTVKTMPDLIVLPTFIDSFLLPDTSEERELTVMNRSQNTVSYHIEEDEDWMTAPTESFSLASGLQASHIVMLTCPDAVAHLQGKIKIINESDNVETEVDVRLECEVLDVNPVNARVGGKVGESVSKSFHVHNPTSQTLSVNGVITGFNVTPSNFTLDPNQSVTVEASGSCSAKGETTHLINFTAGGYPHFGTLTKTCTDPGESRGDPHLFTFDRTKYDFQGKGEFIASKWVGGDDSFEVQARQVPWGRSERVTVNKAFAFNVHGDTVSIYQNNHIPQSGGQLMVNHNSVSLNVGEVYALPNSSSSIERTAGGYSVKWENGAEATVSVQSAFLGLGLTPPLITQGELIGLFGNFNSDRTDDFKLRDGTIINSPPSFNELYDCSNNQHCFAYHVNNGWLIRSVDESLFSYSSAESPLTFAPAEGETFPSSGYSLGEFLQEDIVWATGICNEAGVLTPDILESCVIDILLTNEISFAEDLAQMESDGTGSIPPVRFDSSCKALRDSGITTSGNYDIDTDGEGPIAPVTVYCDMTTGEGGWTFLQKINSKSVNHINDSDGCADHGLQMFSPRSQQDYNLARDYMLSLGYNEALGPLGIYHPNHGGGGGQAAYRPMNTYDANNASDYGWVATAGPDWWASNLTTVHEPSGDYRSGCWLDWDYDADGNVTWYNDFDGDDDQSCAYSHFNYMCIHPDNLTLSH